MKATAGFIDRNEILCQATFLRAKEFYGNLGKLRVLEKMLV